MSLTSVQRLALLLTAGLATLLVALALTSTPASASSTFCGGQTVNSSHTCYGAARMVYERIYAIGASTGVCVGYNEVIYAACSPNARANEIAMAFLSGYVTPRVIGQGGNTTVWGYVD
jgi:secreted trypsin-like serine protease